MHFSYEPRILHTLILSRVPQVRDLGPKLFLRYINNLPDAIKSCMKLFADDTKLSGNVSYNDKIDRLKSDLICNL